MKGTIRSDQFDDVYFSVDDGLAETTHVYLDGNDLPTGFSRCGAEVVIAETGFGTGLNFLAAWRLFDKHRSAEQRLHFVSFEQFPLGADEIRAALSPWAEAFGTRIDDMLHVYPERPRGVFSVAVNDSVSLTIYFADVNAVIANVEADVDFWFLDGFTPAKNPEMWTDLLFENMARLSRDGAHLATFTAAGFVKRGLQDAGFEVFKRPGFGRKRDMLVGRISHEGKG